MTRTRAWRRAQRERVCRNRQNLIRDLPVWAMREHSPGEWADRHPLDCGGTRCGTCHPHKWPRVPTLQEQRESQDDVTDLLRWREDDREAAFEAMCDAEMRWLDEREAADDWLGFEPWSDDPWLYEPLTEHERARTLLVGKTLEAW